MSLPNAMRALGAPLVALVAMLLLVQSVVANPLGMVCVEGGAVAVALDADGAPQNGTKAPHCPLCKAFTELDAPVPPGSELAAEFASTAVALPSGLLAPAGAGHRRALPARGPPSA